MHYVDFRDEESNYESSNSSLDPAEEDIPFVDEGGDGEPAENSDMNSSLPRMELKTISTKWKRNFRGIRKWRNE